MSYTQKQDYTVKGKCPKNCGKCCSSILPLSQNEADKINKYLKDHEVKFHNHNVIFLDTYQDICPFLNEDGRCGIYPVRPEVCQTFMCNAPNQHYNHNGKHLINMIISFGPSDVFLPKTTPNLKELDKEYQAKKKQVGFI